MGFCKYVGPAWPLMSQDVEKLLCGRLECSSKPPLVPQVRQARPASYEQKSETLCGCLNEVASLPSSTSTSGLFHEQRRGIR